MKRRQEVAHGKHLEVVEVKGRSPDTLDQVIHANPSADAKGLQVECAHS